MHRANAETQMGRLLAVGVLAACAAVSLVSLIEHVVTGWDGWYLGMLCPLGAIAGYAGQRFRASRERIGPLPGWVFEPVALFVAVQVAVDLTTRSPLVRDWVPVLDGSALLQSVPVILAWMAGGATAQDFADIDAGPEAGRLRAPMRRLPLRLLAVGALTFLCAGLTQARIATVMHLPDATTSGPLVQVAVYFVLATALFAHATYAVQQGRWRDRTIQVAHGLGGRWAGYTAALLGSIAVAAFLLQYTHPLSVASGVGATALAQTQTWLLDLLKHLGGFGLKIQPRQAPRLVPPKGLHFPPLHHGTPPQRSSGGHGNKLGSAIQAILFWVLVLAALGYTIRLLMRGSPGRRWRFPRLPLPRALVALFERLRGILGRRAGKLRLRVPPTVPGRSGLADLLGSGPRFLRGGPRSPRARIIWYYRRAVTQLSRQGYARAGSQAPLEYERSVGKEMVEIGPDLHALTARFLVARYSRHGVGDADAEDARSLWSRIRDRLRQGSG